MPPTGINRRSRLGTWTALSRRQRGFESRWGYKIKPHLTRPSAWRSRRRRQPKRELRERAGARPRRSAGCCRPTQLLWVPRVVSIYVCCVAANGQGRDWDSSDPGPPVVNWARPTDPRPVCKSDHVPLISMHAHDCPVRPRSIISVSCRWRAAGTRSRVTTVR
jgi:hypothetical protein